MQRLTAGLNEGESRSKNTGRSGGTPVGIGGLYQPGRARGYQNQSGYPVGNFCLDGLRPGGAGYRDKPKPEKLSGPGIF